MPADAAGADVFTTQVPGRLDRLPWSRFHWLVVSALGITWILDGLEVTMVGSLAGAISDSPSLHIPPGLFGLSASGYLLGAVVGALFFGWLTDRLGRKKLFYITLLTYVIATIASGLAWNFTSFLIFRFITGMGIGGEYAAVNATIQELIPARRRGFTDLVVNGSFWVGAALGAVGAVFALDPALVNPEWGWRGAFVIGGAIGFVILLLRRWIPESPRWMMTHGDPEGADRVLDEIEGRVRADTGRELPPIEEKPLRLRRHQGGWFAQSARVLLSTYRDRTVLGVCLMAAQAFCFNAVLFTYALVLTRFYGIPNGNVGLYILPFALGNFLGPLVLVGWLFTTGALDAAQQTLAWTVIFFFASAAASSAYLTVGEAFPLEVRAVAISIFYALGTLLGGVSGPWLFGVLIESGERSGVMWGYVIAGVLMLGAAVAELLLGIDAQHRSLEDVAPPLSAA